jgi:hypothetical protein
MTNFKYQVPGICEKTLLSVSLLLKFPGFFRASTKFPGYFQDYARGVEDFIPQPGMLYPCRSWNTFLSWRKKESRTGYVQNFPLPANVCFAGSGMKASREILEFDLYFLQCRDFIRETVISLALPQLHFTSV